MSIAVTDPAYRVRSESGPFALVPIWVLQLGLTGAELATYVALRSFADHQGVAWPKVRTIAERAGVTQRTAEKAIARFRELGLLASEQIKEHGEITGCTYTLRDRYLPSARTVPPVRADGTPPGEADGAPPARRTEQEQTSEQTSGNRPGNFARAPESARLASSLRSDHPNQNDQRRDPGPAYLVATAAAGVDGVIGSVQEQRPGRLTDVARTRAALLPALQGGVPMDTLVKALVWLLDNGKQLAPWTLQEAVAQVTRPRPAYDGW